MNMRGMAAALVVALGTIGAGAAHATTYLLNTSDKFGSGNFGQVTVTGSSTDLHFDVQMFGSYQIIDTGSHSAFTGNLAGTFTSANLVLPASETGDFSLSTGSISNPGFSGFNFGLNCLSCGSGSSNPFGNHLTFDITGTGLSVLAADDHNNEHIYFASDVTNADGVTGPVGGGPVTGGVPEPATWGLMIVGLMSIGAALRKQRKTLVVA